MANDFLPCGKLRGLCAKGCGRQDNQLNTYDYFADIPGNESTTDLVEVQFKNTHKAYFHNSNNLPLQKGDIVAVEASPGHDIGTVTLTGRLVPLQMRRANLKPNTEIRRIYRKARAVDMEKYEEAKAREHDTMIRSRQIAAGLGLQNMVSNLVAGLTILFERPLKPGDWIIINGQEGVVKQINIRSTTLEAPNKADIIIPNSEIISSSLVNLTYADKIGRAEINVSVDYDCDIELVKQTLIDIALQNPFVMKNPSPSVSVSNFSSSGLELQLNCFLANVYNKGSVTNDIKEDILKKFRELGINFPTPCHVVRILNDFNSVSN